MTDKSYMFPLSFAQQRLWFMEQLAPGKPFYNLPSALDIEGPLEAEIIKKSLNEIVSRHETLRTCFKNVDGEPRQVVLDAVEFEMPLIDLSGIPPEERSRKADSICAEEGVKPFHLSSPPLFRARLLRMNRLEHILIFNIHHIIADGWSMGVLMDEIKKLYNIFSGDSGGKLPSLPIQYADYAVWQRRHLRGRVMELHLEYWKKKLEGAPPVLSLPSDRPRPPVPSFTGDNYNFRLSGHIHDRVIRISRDQGVTSYMIFMAAFAALLSRYSCQDDMVVGFPIANRTRAELEKLIGFFVNTLVLRIGLSGDPTLKELIRRVREVALDAYQHQDLPFEVLVRELSPERDISMNPICQVVLAMQNTPPDTEEIEGLEIHHREIKTGTTRFDIALHIREEKDGGGVFTGNCIYSTDLFDRSTIAGMVDNLVKLLEQGLSDPGLPLSNISLMDAEEERKILIDWNSTGRELSGPGTIHGMVEKAVAVHPDDTAVECMGDDSRLSYRELDSMAGRIAAFLIRRELGREAAVGVCMRRSPGMVAAVLGILRAGMAFVPMDPGYPEERLKYITGDSGSEIVITDILPADCRLGEGTEVVKIDTIVENQHPAREPAAIPVKGDNLAYILYTSGTTGRPKGVMIQHSSVVNYTSWVLENLTGEGCVIPLSTGLVFDASLKQLFGSLASGRGVKIVSEEDLLDPEELCRYLSSFSSVAFNCVPSLWETLIGTLQDRRDKNMDMPVDRLLLGGESLSSDLVDRTREVLPGTEIWNLYGPTETTANVTAAILNRRGGVPIGRPLWNTRVYVLDWEMKPVGRGIPGELYVGGMGVARGYLNRPALTAERFVPHPFGEGERLYRTGDLVRWNEDGELEFIRRLDDQIKLRGFRIEPQEIESVLRNYQGVKDSYVTLWEGDAGESMLAAYISGPSGISGDKLRSYLAGELPSYMIPSAYVWMEELPRDSAGRLNREQLPPPGIEGTAEEKDQHPRNEVEEVISGIFGEVAGVDRVGIHQDFFTQLGGHSLLATQLMLRLRDILRFEVDLQNIFRRPTVAGLAELAVEDPRNRERVRKVARHLIAISKLTDEEVDRMLSEDQ